MITLPIFELEKYYSHRKIIPNVFYIIYFYLMANEVIFNDFGVFFVLKND